MPAFSIAGPWSGQKKADVFSEAIEATGGPNSEALETIKSYIDENYPDFAWTAKWPSEIMAAKAQQRAKLRLPTRERAGSQPPTSPGGPIDITCIERAKKFIEEIGGGSVVKAQTALKLIEDVDDLQRLKVAIEAWAELLEAVHGDGEKADRVLAVIAGQSWPTAFPRLVEINVASDAA